MVILVDASEMPKKKRFTLNQRVAVENFNIWWAEKEKKMFKMCEHVKQRR